MHDNDSFRLIDPDLAVGLFCAGLALVAVFWGAPEPRVAKAATKRSLCDVTVAQYGAGERWVMLPKDPQCAGRVVPAPNHVISFPLGGPSAVRSSSSHPPRAGFVVAQQEGSSK